MKVDNRTFIISGGSSGLGLATAKDLLASLSTHVAILDLSPPPSVLSSDHVKFFKTDITESSQVEAAVEGVVRWTQETGARLGGVVNCAGVGIAAKIIDSNDDPHSLELWDFTLAVNLTGAFNLTRLALKHLVHVPPDQEGDGERGVIILVSSAAAFEGQPGQMAYAAAKGALRSMALPLARDLARHGVRVVAIAPGAFESSMTEQLSEKVKKSIRRDGIIFPPRFGHPAEFARTVRWVMECSYVNGETIRLSGGGRLPAKL